jgi:hypothetical protein
VLAKVKRLSQVLFDEADPRGVLRRAMAPYCEAMRKKTKVILTPEGAIDGIYTPEEFKVRVAELRAKHKNIARKGGFK